MPETSAGIASALGLVSSQDSGGSRLLGEFTPPPPRGGEQVSINGPLIRVCMRIAARM
jgi:hypothetical protein